MKTLTSNQIAEIKNLKPYNTMSFHGNRKKVGSLPVNIYKEVIEKKKMRELSKLDNSIDSPVAIAKSCIALVKNSKGTNYFKVMIEGNNNIYLASPTYMHADYNKTRLFSKNEKTLKIMNLFNSIINK